MNSPRSAEGRFARLFRDRYLRSLDDYRFFYDDVASIGDPSTANHVFYFVPGINGTPGQMRFILPSLIRVFGHRIHLQALALPEFSSRRPTWMKYTTANVDRKLATLRTDLDRLLARHEHLIVIASSSGFYDFAAAAGSLPPDVLRERIHLIWGACAPDHFGPTRWEKVFYPCNGFTYHGHRWFACPNHNALSVFNPETSHAHRWSDGGDHRHFRKADLESRFRVFGLEWNYVSPAQLGAATRHVVRQIQGPLACPACALVAANDGYWQGRSRDTVERTIRRHLPHAEITFKPASHLWVVTPSHVTEVLRTTKRNLTNGLPSVPPLPLCSTQPAPAGALRSSPQTAALRCAPPAWETAPRSTRPSPI